MCTVGTRVYPSSRDPDRLADLVLLTDGDLLFDLLLRERLVLVFEVGDWLGDRFAVFAFFFFVFFLAGTGSGESGFPSTNAPHRRCLAELHESVGDAARGWAISASRYLCALALLLLDLDEPLLRIDLCRGEAELLLAPPRLFVFNWMFTLSPIKSSSLTLSLGLLFARFFFWFDFGLPARACPASAASGDLFFWSLLFGIPV